MIIQWTRSNWHKERFRVRTLNIIITSNFFEWLFNEHEVIGTKKAFVLEHSTQLSTFWKKNYIEFWLFFLLTAFLSYLLPKNLGVYNGENEDIDSGSYN